MPDVRVFSSATIRKSNFYLALMMLQWGGSSSFARPTTLNFFEDLDLYRDRLNRRLGDHFEVEAEQPDSDESHFRDWRRLRDNELQ